MTTLTEFLLERIVEDEAVAKAATPGPWGDPEEDFGYGDFGWYVHGCPAGETEDSEQGRADIKYIARNHPARVLAECAAKRQIVEIAGPARDENGDLLPGSGIPDILRALAAVYANHPDYRAEWAL